MIKLAKDDVEFFGLGFILVCIFIVAILLFLVIPLYSNYLDDKQYDCYFDNNNEIDCIKCMRDLHSYVQKAKDVCNDIEKKDVIKSENKR